ncbi:choline transport system permease protein OpuBB [Streptomyces jeddahensis]|uniref:Choline transport system permease protein OpuBB n=1 Tax=Streptomyces jeddahensis TaxID=1716141 RepID=A0A177HW15_9ACTN|nr:choline transport system permease protein OpuBB [Streptomyces jeddahensis]
MKRVPGDRGTKPPRGPRLPKDRDTTLPKDEAPGTGLSDGERDYEELLAREERAAEQQTLGAAAVRAREPARVTWQKLTYLPAVVMAVLLATWIWFATADLDPISRNALADGVVWLRLRQHVALTVISTFFVLIIAIPLGILLTRGRMRKAAPFAVALANIGQATPAIGLLALLVIWLGIGQKAALIGIIIYAVLPVLSNTIAGLKANDPTLLEAARGIGMSPLGVLAKVELPLAVPLILAGVRTALVLNVGTATLATFGGGGGLGDLISTGITGQRMPVLMLGSVLTIALALLVDWLASLAELVLRPRGLEVRR